LVLSDKMAYRQIIGGLMYNTLLFIEYPDILPTDFDYKVARICLIAIQNLYEEGATKLTIPEVENEILKNQGIGATIYKQENGLDFLKTAYEFAEVSNFEVYYNRLKKYSLLRTLQKAKFDISYYYKEDKDLGPLEEDTLQKRFNEDGLQDILNKIEGKYNSIKNDYLNTNRKKSDPSEGIFELIDDLQKKPNVGPNLEGDYFSTACRGARAGCFYLKSASSGAGKSRTSIFDACKIAYPIRFSLEKNSFIHELNKDGTRRQPRKTLFIVTEMDKEELQTIMLAYLSKVNEAHILTGQCDFDELNRVKFAAKIIKEYRDYFIIEEISDPNLTNIEATIKKYATIDNIKYCFFDYIHSTASMLNQFAKNNLREDVVLMMMANQLKQLAKDYNIFIFSATQVNSGAMIDDETFKNETCIRGSKAVADKADVGYVMTRIGQKTWNAVIGPLRQAARDGTLDSKFIENEKYRPTHILDIYKNRRGKYKNIRIWVHLDLGTGERNDVFITDTDNKPIANLLESFKSYTEEKIDWSNYFDN